MTSQLCPGLSQPLAYEANKGKVMGLVSFNHFLSSDTIMDLLPNVCSFPMEKGPCQAYMSRWFFNSETGECELFAYGGCRGNSNNFSTKEKCEKMCKFTWFSNKNTALHGFGIDLRAIEVIFIFIFCEQEIHSSTPTFILPDVLLNMLHLCARNSINIAIKFKISRPPF